MRGVTSACFGGVPVSVSSPRSRNGVAKVVVDSEARWGALMAAAQGGDGAAYAALLRDCIPFIRTVVAGSGVPAGSVDDVVQNVLMAVHRARHTYDPRQAFAPWLRTIAQRRAIDTLRSAGRLHGREVHAPSQYESHPDPSPAAAHAVEQADDDARLRAAVAGLPERQRQAVELLSLQEFTLEEAASATGRTKTALKVNLHRALKALRLKLHRDD
jgi:RNA polymerase sigma-70 factor (ECF subfamily)